MKFAKDDRVRVTNLRNGTVNYGVVIDPEYIPGKVVVKYDDGTVVQVGEGFVSKA